MDKILKEQKRHLREEKELSRLLKEQSAPTPKYYFIYLIMILTLVYIIDEVITNLHSNLITEISYNLGVKVSTFNLVDALSILMLVTCVFYKPLADRFGRRAFLFINTIAMGGAIAICALAFKNAPWIYFIGYFLMRFFVTPDVQVIYIIETAPEKKRATINALVKGVAEFGLILIPLLRTWIIGGNLFGTASEEELASMNVGNWRWVFLIAAIIAFVISFLALFFAKETKPYLDSRINYLKQSDEEREANKKKDASDAQGGLIKALIHIVKNKQLLFIVLVTFIYTLARVVTNNYALFLSWSTQTNYLIANGISEANRATAVNLASNVLTQATFFLPISCGVITLAYGFVSDKIGRKMTCIILLAICAITFGLYVGGSLYNWPIWLMGLLVGLFLGAFWNTGDTLILMCGESSPTNLRASIISAQSAFYGAGMGISSLLGGLLLGPIENGFNGETEVANLSSYPIQLVTRMAIVGLSAMVISLVLLMIFVEETKNYTIGTEQTIEE